MSLTPTITSAKLLRRVGPPEALSSMAVTFRVYCGPFRLGGGFLRSLMIPEFGNIKCHVNLLYKYTKSCEHHVSLSLCCWLSLYFGWKAQEPVILVCTALDQDPKFWLIAEELSSYQRTNPHWYKTSPFADYINMVLSSGFWHTGGTESIEIRQ